MRWYRQAAEQGDALGQNQLGWMYQKGLGVDLDYYEAVRWYRLAAAQGYRHAKKNLDRAERERGR